MSDGSKTKCPFVIGLVEMIFNLLILLISISFIKSENMSLWLRLKKSDTINSCIEILGEKFNGDKPYKIFPPHITIVPSISSEEDIDPKEIMIAIKETIDEVKKELGKGKTSLHMILLYHFSASTNI